MYAFFFSLSQLSYLCISLTHDTLQSGGSPVSDFLSAIEAETGIGSAYWSLFGHDDDCCQYVDHDDGFSLYYPGRTAVMAAKVAKLVASIFSFVRLSPSFSVDLAVC